jgi:hypothetical protein
MREKAEASTTAEALAQVKPANPQLAVANRKFRRPHRNLASTLCQQFKILCLLNKNGPRPPQNLSPVYRGTRRPPMAAARSAPNSPMLAPKTKKAAVARSL